MMGAILDHLWQSTLLALGVGLLTLAFRKAAPSVRHGLWFVASAKFLLPFAALAALGRMLAPTGRPPVEATPEAVFIAQATEPFSQSYSMSPVVHVATPVAHAAPGFDPALILLAVWALGSAALLIAWMVRWTRVRRAARSATPLPWRAPMPVRASPSLLEPGLVGLWRPVLIVPDTLFDHLTLPEIDALVAHEACHLRRRDNLTAAIHMLVEALFWFHPLVWWIGARLIAERERACDEAVVRSGHDRTAYARGLLECCRLYLQSPLPCVAGASGSNLKTRVEMIMTAPLSTPLSPTKKMLLLATGLCAFASPVAAGLLTSPTGRQAEARVAAIASRPAAVGFGDARPAGPTSTAAFTPEQSGAETTFALAQDGAISAPGANTQTAPASSAQDAAGQLQPVQDKAANGSSQPNAPTLVAALEPAVAARVADQTTQARQTSNEEAPPDQEQSARGPFGPGHYVQVSDMRRSGVCASWSPWYAVTTSPIAEGYSIRNFSFALRGDIHCGGRRPLDVRAECEIETDAPDKKTVVFRMQGNSNECFVDANPFGDSAHVASISGSVAQAEMVLSYDVQ